MKYGKDTSFSSNSLLNAWLRRNNVSVREGGWSKATIWLPRLSMRQRAWDAWSQVTCLGRYYLHNMWGLRVTPDSLASLPSSNSWILPLMHKHGLCLTTATMIWIINYDSSLLKFPSACTSTLTDLLGEFFRFCFIALNTNVEIPSSRYTLV